MLRSDLRDFSDAYIVVKEYIAVTDPDDAKRNKSVAFKDNALFINYISKINGIQVDNAEKLDVVMPMYNLLEYSKNSKKNKKKQEVCGIITEMNQVILFLLILNLLNIRQVLLGIFMMVIIQTKVVKIKLK